jgi:drug/metabolite transporter (DMT)-like permease
LAYVTSVAIGYFVFRETISVTQAIGLAAIVFGVMLVVTQR